MARVACNADCGMAPLTIMTIVGTRPEAVKLSPVILELGRHPERVRSVVCATAQHREMLDQVLRLFDIAPHFDLDVMQPDQRLPDLTARLLVALDRVIEQVQPDWVLVQGDTTTVLAASLVAFYHRVRVGHVEAGLRSHDKFQPFPEEINRRIADVLADLYFAPTEAARSNLRREGVPDDRIVVTGNPALDALRLVADRADLSRLDPLIGDLDGKRLILVTAHRRENFGRPLSRICRALRTLAARYGDAVRIVYPVHFNPNIAGPARELLGDVPNITLIEPVDYATMIALMKRADLILTDSGGIQEEAPSLHKPVLILREVTERHEVVALGAARLVGSDEDLIVNETARLLEDTDAYRRMASVPNPYGDGHASERIVEAILRAEC